MAAVKMKIQPTFGPPRCRNLRSSPIVFTQPNTSSNELPLPLTDAVCRMLRRPGIDTTAAIARLGYCAVRRDDHLAQAGDEPPLVVVLVHTDRDAPARQSRRHLHRPRSWGFAFPPNDFRGRMF